MGSTVFPAASSGGSTPIAGAGALVCSGSQATNGFYLSDTLPIGEYIIYGEIPRNQSNTYPQNYMTISSPANNIWQAQEVVSAAEPIRVKITTPEKLCLSSIWRKWGSDIFGTGDTLMGVAPGGGYQWVSRYPNVRFRNTDKVFYWSKYGGNNDSRQDYWDFSNGIAPDTLRLPTASGSNADASLGTAGNGNTGGGIVGNFMWQSFRTETGAQRFWRANLSTPGTWTVGTTAATTTGGIMDIAYDGSTYVLVTSTGQINTSPDFATWTKQTSPATSGLVGITYAGGLFVAVGQSGNIVTSSNGFTWTKRTAPYAVEYVSVEYINSQFVIAGSVGSNMDYPWYTNDANTNKYYAKSSDGITWTAFDLQFTAQGNSISPSLRHATAVNGRTGNFPYINDENNVEFGRYNSTFVWNGYVYIREGFTGSLFVSNDLTNWYVMGAYVNPANIVTSPTNGLLNISHNANFGSQRVVIYASKPSDARFFVYKAA